MDTFREQEKNFWVIISIWYFFDFFTEYPITYFNDFVKTHMAKWTEECNDKTVSK